MRSLRWFFVLLPLLWFSPFGSSTALQLNDFVREYGGQWSVQHPFSSSSIAIFGRSEKRFLSPESGLSAILSRYSSLLGISRPSDLRLKNKAQSPDAIHFYLQQYYAGFSVLGAEVSIHFNSQNQVIALFSNIRKLHGERPWNTDIRNAQATVQRVFGNDVVIVSRGLKVVAERKPRLVWHFETYSRHPGRGAWTAWVDAESQDTVFVQPLHFTFDGTGRIWAENPVRTPSRVNATLKYLDASKSLSGRFARTFNANGIRDFQIPIVISDYTTAKNPDRKFVFPEENLKSVEAMAYFHISRVHDRWKSLGFNGLDKRAPIFVNVTETENGPGWDNAMHSRSNQFKSTGIYVFGAGNVFENLGLDADLYYHEYAHGVLDTIRPALLDQPQASVYQFSFHEAFSDVSAAAITGNSKIGEFGFRIRESRKFEGRNLQNNRRFPQNVIDPSIGLSEPHHASLILSGAWWDLKKSIGVYVAQRLLLESAYLVPVNVDFFHVRDAILTADESVYSGAHRKMILQAFQRHGLEGPNPGPPGNVSVGNALMIGDVGGAKVVKSDFSRGSIIYLGLEYSAGSKVPPGYFLVPEGLKFQKPAGSNAFIQWGIPEIFAGQFRGADAAVLLHVITDQSTTPGTYTLTFSPSIGGANRTSASRTVSFRIQ